MSTFLSADAIAYWRILSNIDNWRISSTNVVGADKARVFDAPITGGLFAPEPRIDPLYHLYMWREGGDDKYEIKKTEISKGWIFATDSDLIVFDSRTRGVSCTVPYRHIQSVEYNPKIVSVSLTLDHMRAATDQMLLLTKESAKRLAADPRQQMMAAVLGDKYLEIARQSAADAAFLGVSTALVIVVKYPRPSVLGALALLGAPPSEKIFHHAVLDGKKREGASFLDLFLGFFHYIADQNRRMAAADK